MLLKEWNKLPADMQTEEVRPYYDILRRKAPYLVVKRIIDIVLSFALIVILFPLFLLLAILIRCDSKGPVFYRQARITQYGKQFKIFKFRTMYHTADNGSFLTAHNDSRITRLGRFIRKYRIDEFAQLLDVFRGKMTFVGTRPEALPFVREYTPEMRATLLLPAGITSLASIYFKDEDEILSTSQNPEKDYIDNILPAKMELNLESLKTISFSSEIKIVFMTVLALLGRKK